MQISFLSKLLISFLIACFLLSFVFMPSEVQASWHSKDLPGKSDSDMLTYVLIAAGAVVVVCLIMKASQPKKRPENQNPQQKENTNVPEDSLKSFNLNNDSQNHLIFYSNSIRKKDFKILPLLSLKQLPNSDLNFQNSGDLFKDKAIMLGFALRF